MTLSPEQKEILKNELAVIHGRSSMHKSSIKSLTGQMKSIASQLAMHQKNSNSSDESIAIITSLINAG